MSHHQKAAPAPRGLHHGMAIFRREGQRLLDKDVLPGFQGGDGHGGVVFGRSGDRHRVDPGIGQHLLESRKNAHARVLIRQAFGAFYVNVENCSQVSELIEIAHQILAPMAATGHANSGGNPGL